MLKNANFLILDEPTNHLDIVGKEALEEALQNYDGTLLFVSHDRYFISKMATSILEIKDGRNELYPYGWQQYLEKEESAVIEKKEEKKLKEVSAPRKKVSSTEIKRIEAKIEEKELELEEARALRFEPEYYQDGIKMNELDNHIDDLVNEVASLMQKWEEMMEDAV